MRDAHRRRLAGAVGAAEAEHRAGRDREADAVEHVVLAEALVQPVELEHRSSCRRDRLPRTVSAAPPRAATPRCGVIAGMNQENRSGAAARGRGPRRAARRRPRAAAPASSGSRRPRPSSARGRRRRGSCSSASSPATRRTGRASRSSAPPGGCSTRRSRDAGIDRRDAYITNAVKHFRFTPKGKRRIHQTPGPEHLRACRPWLEAEFAVLQPEVVVCLGATAAKALISPSFRITKDRGQLLPWTPPGATTAPEATDDDEDAPHQTWMLATTHPSAILRTPDEARGAAYDALVADLAGRARPARSPRDVRCCRTRRPERVCVQNAGRRRDIDPAGSAKSTAAAGRRGTARTTGRPARRRPSPRRSSRRRTPSPTVTPTPRWRAPRPAGRPAAAPRRRRR